MSLYDEDNILGGKTARINSFNPQNFGLVPSTIESKTNVHHNCGELNPLANQQACRSNLPTALVTHNSAIFDNQIRDTYKSHTASHPLDSSNQSGVNTKTPRLNNNEIKSEFCQATVINNYSHVNTQTSDDVNRPIVLRSPSLGQHGTLKGQGHEKKWEALNDAISGSSHPKQSSLLPPMNPPMAMDSSEEFIRPHNPPGLVANQQQKRSKGRLKDHIRKESRVKTIQKSATVITATCAQCHNMTRIGSQFCSDQCGVLFMLDVVSKEKEEETRECLRQRFEERKKHIMDQIQEDIKNNRICNLAEQDEIKTLNEIVLERKNLIEQLKGLNEKKRTFELITECIQLELANNHGVKSMNTQGQRRSGTNNDVVDCINCGHTFSINAFATHIHTCYHKMESSMAFTSAFPTPEDCSTLIYCDFYDVKMKTYCKKLKASCSLHSNLSGFKLKSSYGQGICGIPIGPIESGERCMLSKKACKKHVNWDNIRRSSLMLEEISLNQLKSVLDWEESSIMERMVFQRLCRVQETDHKTIIESKQLAFGSF